MYSYVFLHSLLLCQAHNIILNICQCCISIDDIYGNDKPDNRQLLCQHHTSFIQEFCVVLAMGWHADGASAC